MHIQQTQKPTTPSAFSSAQQQFPSLAQPYNGCEKPASTLIKPGYPPVLVAQKTDNDVSAIKALRAKLWRAGFRPLAIYNINVTRTRGGQSIESKSRGKTPVGKDCLNLARRSPPEWATQEAELDALNTGILCDGLRALDIDIDDRTLAETIQTGAVEQFGAAPVRWREHSGRMLMLYRAAVGEPVKRCISGTAGKVEVLGRGQQFVAFGNHYAHGAALQWRGGTPGDDVTLDDLPAITEEQVRDFLAWAAPLIGSKGEDRGAGDRVSSNQGLIAKNQAALIEAMGYIPNNGSADWENWNRIGMALWAGSAGSEDGRKAWHDWSAKHAAHNVATTETRWQTYRSSPPDRIGAGLIFHEARQHGWKGNLADPAEGFASVKLIATSPEHAVLEAISVKRQNTLAELSRVGRHQDVMPTQDNVARILKEDPLLLGLVGLDQFASRLMIWRSPPAVRGMDSAARGPYPREMCDSDETRILAYIHQNWCPNLRTTMLAAALRVEAEDNGFHPVAQWLETLDWDGSPRLDTWLCRVFGADDTQYTRAVAAKMLIAAVRRVRVPGCKFDYLPVLAGAQGIGKSRALAVLFGRKWFTDSLHDDLSSKEAAMGLAGVWAVELSEITQLVRSRTETAKAFLSRSVDRYREPYAQRTVDVPRQCILIGTTNADSFLVDATGNRRYWPVQCSKDFADIGWVESNRDQLWAEAALREARDETIWLDDDTIRREAEAAQDAVFEPDPWEAQLVSHLRAEPVRIPDLMRNALNLAPSQQDKATQGRIAAVLKRLGWTRRKTWDAAARNSVQTWFPPEMWHPASSPDGCTFPPDAGVGR